MKAQRRTVDYDTEGGKSSSRVLLTLVIPTRNEVDNVPELVTELRESLVGVDYRVVFVDDSTDGTPAVIRDLAREDGRVSLVRREGAERRGGLSTAVTRGLDLSSRASEYTCVMDADLQHPPEKVREMLETARRTGADVVVASRYAEGASYTGLSGTTRRAVSVGSKYLARIVFKEARKTSDPMTGFFLLKNEAISGIQFRPTGFKVLLEILVCAPELKVIEAPFDFRARHAGVSKLSNFLLNNAFTWRDVRHSSRIHFFRRGVLAYPVAVMGIGANFAVWYPLVKYVSDDFPYYALFNLLGIVAGTSVNFILSSQLVFRPSTPKNLDPDPPK